jgi:hypothetical protein
MYCFQNFLSTMSAALNFQFFSGSSMRAQKALSLFFLREMEEELDDAGSVAVEVFLQIHDRTIPVVPDRLVVVWRAGSPFAAENFAVHADDQHLLVVRPIEDADPPAFPVARGWCARESRVAIRRDWDV